MNETLEDAILREFPEFTTDDDVNGGDLVEFIAAWLRKRGRGSQRWFDGYEES